MVNKLKAYYQKLDELGKVTFVTILVQLFIFLAMSFCYFIGFYSIPLGFLLGSLIADISFIMLQRQMDALLDMGQTTVKRKTIANFMLRSLLYIAGLAIAATLSYFKIEVFNVFAVFAAYIVPKIVIYAMGGRRVKTTD